MQAYTYSILHIPSNSIYYGVRKSTTFDLFSEYFTSSKVVKNLIEQDGKDAFICKLRRTFNSYAEARLYETKLLQRVSAISNPRFLNQAISSPRLCSADPDTELKRRQSISASMKKLWQDPNYSDNHGFRNIDSEELSRRGRAGSLARAAKYESGELKRVIPKKKTYKEVTIIRDGKIKIVKSNQVPAYKKCGWLRS